MQRTVGHAVGMVLQRARRPRHPLMKLKRESVANDLGVHACDLRNDRCEVIGKTFDAAGTSRFHVREYAGGVTAVR